MAAPTTTATRVAFNTGAPDFTAGAGILFDDGMLLYRLTKNSIVQGEVAGAVADITYRFGRNTDYEMNYLDDAPTLTSITPATDVAAGGAAFTLVGVNLAGDGSTATTVAIGGNAATSLVIADSGLSITGVVPAHAAGTVNVVVVTTGGTSTMTNGFVYTA